MRRVLVIVVCLLLLVITLPVYLMGFVYALGISSFDQGVLAYPKLYTWIRGTK
jgi:hypothetical protein